MDWFCTPCNQWHGFGDRCDYWDAQGDYWDSPLETPRSERVAGMRWPNEGESMWDYAGFVKAVLIANGVVVEAPDA